MSLIFWMVLKATLILLAGLAAASAAGKARASVRHLILASTFVALLILPVVSLVAAPSVIELTILEPSKLSGSEDKTSEHRRNTARAPVIGAAVEFDEPSAAIAATSTSFPRWSAVTISALIWGGGVTFLVAVFAAALLRLWRIRRRGMPWIAGEDLANELARAREVSRGVALALHEGVAAPITYGVVRPLIVLPTDAISWAEADLQRALVHEIEHVRRGDWVTQVMARGVSALYWFHPLVWVAWRKLCLEGERACDDAVLLGSQGTDYAQQLVALAQRLSREQGGLVLSMANRSDLSVRVRAVLDGNQTRGRAGRTVVAAIAGMAALLAAGVAPVSVVAVSKQATLQTPTAEDRAAADKALVEKQQLERERRLELERAAKLKGARAEILEKMKRADAELAMKSPRERAEMTERLLRELEAREKALAGSGGVEGGVSGGVKGGVAGGVSGGVTGTLKNKEVREQMAMIERLARSERAAREKQVHELATQQEKLEREYRNNIERDALKQAEIEREYRNIVEKDALKKAELDREYRNSAEKDALKEAEAETKMRVKEREYLAQGRKFERGERRSGRRALGEALINAAEDGDIAFVTELLDGGLDVNTVVPGDGTALIGAARGSQLEMTEFLLGRGAKPNVVVSGDGSPLIAAAQEGSLDVVRLLLERGADINLGVPGDGNPLIMAAGEGRVHVVEFLLDRGADIEKVVPGDENPLIHACEGGSLEVVKLLVERGANINARVRAEYGGDREKGGEWRTPLSMARRNGHQAIVDFLMSRGANDSQP